MNRTSDSDPRQPFANGTVRLVIAIATLLGALLGTGGTVGLHYINPAVLRDDPFTGTDWTDRSAALSRATDMVADEVALLEQRVIFAETIFTRHEEELTKELREIRTMLADVAGQLKAISAGVSNLPPAEWRRRIEALEDDRIRNDPDYRVPR